MRDARDHRAQRAIPFGQFAARLIQRPRQEPDLVGAADRNRRSRSPAPHRARRLDQIAERSRQTAREPDAQARRRGEPDETNQQDPAAACADLAQKSCVRLDAHEADDLSADEKRTHTRSCECRPAHPGTEGTKAVRPCAA